MWICFHGYGARELYLVFAHNNSYEIKLAVAVTPTISSAPSTPASAPTAPAPIATAGKAACSALYLALFLLSSACNCFCHASEATNSHSKIQ
jgi:hypothetical protein